MSFEEIYSSEDWYYKLPPSEELEAYLRTVTGNNKTALDLGCGEGRDSILLARTGFRVTSIDASSRAIEKLQKFAALTDLRIDASCQDIDTLEISPASYDAICAVTVIDHLEPQSGRRLASQIVQGLRPNGFAFVEVFTVHDPGHTGHGTASETANFVRHYFQDGELKEMFGALDILLYEEKLEDDLSHGPKHEHGVAVLIAKKSP